MNMFNLKDFQNDLVLEPIVLKLNKYLSKNKTQKVIKIIEELENLLEKPEKVVAITFILSILAEHDSNLITEGIFQKIVKLLNSEDNKLKVNSITIIGFKLLSSRDLTNNYFKKLAEYLTDKSIDVRDNVHFFLLKLVKDNPDLVNSIINILLNSLSMEHIKNNRLSLLNLLSFCEVLDFNQLYSLREIAKSFISSHSDESKSELVNKLFGTMSKFFPDLKEYKLELLKTQELLELLDNQFIMRRYNFNEISAKSKIKLRNYIEEIKKKGFNDKKILFYTKSKRNLIYIYEIEKSKLLNLFEDNFYISNDRIKNYFSQIIKSESELDIFIKTLIKLKKINGYYSDLGIFYSYNQLKSKFEEELNQNGIINIKKYNYFPFEFLDEIINDIKNSQKDKLLVGKEKKLFYSLKRIKEQIDIEAAKNSVIDLKSYRGRLMEKDFISLIKNLPKEYITRYHKGTQWLTNLGALKVSNEIQNSKVFGFFDINKISQKLNIGQILLIDVFDNIVDQRSGIWDRRKEVFYYSKHLIEKIETIRAMSDEEDKSNQIKSLANELNINENLIITKIDENLKSIADEIKKKKQIRVSVYLEKTGMDMDSFLKFIDEIEITYFKKEDWLIFNPKKIEEVKNDIKYMLLDKSKSEDSITLGNFDIKSDLIEELIKDLLEDGKLKGIFYEYEGELKFYTKRGIRNLMLENDFIFSFNDLFYGKELIQEEIELLRDIFDELINNSRLKGSFDEDTLTFSSEEILFAKDYNTVLFEFEKKVSNYILIFQSEFKRIKKILTKREETIFPQEIKLIQEIIDKINERYIKWRGDLDAFVRRFNKKFLREQGVSVKSYRQLFSSKKKNEIKAFGEDPEVYENLKNFDSWVKLFNHIETKYPNVIFYQKRLINNPEDKDSEKKLLELSEELNLN